MFALLRRVRLVLSTALADVETVETISIDGPVLCAGPLIEQVLINLIDNAIDAAGPAGRSRSLRTGRSVLQ